MNLSTLFQMQKELDDYIIEKKGLQGVDLLPQKILSLQVELGECANEWRGFKFWSERQTPTEPEYNWKPNADGSNLEWKEEYGYKKHPLLEEYVDCLHFILSIGLNYDYENLIYVHENNISAFESSWGITEQFTDIYTAISNFIQDTEDQELYEDIFCYFNSLGHMLGFTWNQIESAYTEKWNINKKRQESGY